MATKSRCRIAVDFGGTFTDVALESQQNQYTAKPLTTTPKPEEGVISGVLDVLEQSQIDAADVDILIYGPTLATNLLIERAGSPVALLTTQGFRDSI